MLTIPVIFSSYFKTTRHVSRVSWSRSSRPGTGRRGARKGPRPCVPIARRTWCGPALPTCGFLIKDTAIRLILQHVGHVLVTWPTPALLPAPSPLGHNVPGAQAIRSQPLVIAPVVAQERHQHRRILALQRDAKHLPCLGPYFASKRLGGPVLPIGFRLQPHALLQAPQIHLGLRLRLQLVQREPRIVAVVALVVHLRLSIIEISLILLMPIIEYNIYMMYNRYIIFFNVYN